MFLNLVLSYCFMFGLVCGLQGGGGFGRVLPQGLDCFIENRAYFFLDSNPLKNEPLPTALGRLDIFVAFAYWLCPGSPPPYSSVSPLPRVFVAKGTESGGGEAGMVSEKHIFFSRCLLIIMIFFFGVVFILFWDSVVVMCEHVRFDLSRNSSPRVSLTAEPPALPPIDRRWR